MLLKHYVTEACAILITLMRLSPSINSPMYGDFPGGPVVKTSPSKAGGVGSIPGHGANIPHALEAKKKQNIKQKQYCNKFNKDLKNGPHFFFK